MPSIYSLRRKISSNKVRKELLRLAIPIVLGQLGIIIVGFADNIMVGHHLKSELAAASFVNNIFALIVIMGMGFSYGLTPVVARYMAKGEEQRAGHLLRYSLILNFGIGLILTLAMTLLLIKIDVFRLPETVMPHVRPYYIIQMATLVPLMLFNGYKQFFDGAGRTKIGMYVIFITNIVNIAGNFLLIYGVGFFPELGLLGAGLSTLFSRLVGLLALIWVFAKKEEWRAARLGFRAKSSGRGPYLKLFSLGLPVSLQMGMESASFTIAVIFVGLIGENALAAHQVVAIVATFGFMFYQSLGAALVVRIGAARAQNDIATIKAVTRSAIQMSLVVLILFSVVTLFMRHLVGFIFTPDRDVVAIVAVVLIPVVVYQIGDVIQAIYSSALRGLEDVTYMAWAAFFCHMLLAPVLSYVFAFKLGIEAEGLRLAAVWFAFPFSLTALGLLLRGRYHRILSSKKEQ